MNSFTARKLREADTLARMRSKDPSLNKSIHPRVKKQGQGIGRTVHAKGDGLTPSNTAKEPRK